tara:strand:- start:618 stop:1706 length:1089 start_codon:yes stop_codon:yes gene_type:complete
MTQTIIKIPAAGAFDPTDIEITDNTSAAFLVQDSSQEYIRVDTTTGARKIDLETGLANQYLIISEGANYIQLRNGAQNQFFMSNLSTTQAAIKFFSHEQYSGGYFRIRNSGSAEIFRLDEDSNAAFTLDSGSSATFEVKHGAMTTTYNQFFKAQEGVGTIITPGDGNSIQISNANTAANLPDRLIFHYYQNNYLEQYQMPKWYIAQRTTTSSAASSNLTYDLRMGRSHSSGHIKTNVNSSYSGTHAFTAKLTNTLSSFAGNQNWAVTSQVLRFTNENTSDGATLQFAVDVGGSIHFVNNSGITTGISNPVSGTQAMAVKGSASAGTYSQFVYRISQYNTLEGSASRYDDDRYILELLYAELI